MARSTTSGVCCEKVRPENAARLFPNPASILFSSTVVKLLSTKRRIMEVGGGCLRNAAYLLGMGHSVTVLEVPRIKERFPDQYEKFVKQGGVFVERWPKRCAFDMVVVTFVVETICNPSARSALLRGVNEHLTSDGVLVLSARGPKDLLTAQNRGVRCGDGYLTPNFSFARSYTRVQMERLLKNMGFKTHFLHKDSTKEPEYLHVVARKTDE